MIPENIKKEYSELVETLNEHSRLYYVEDNPQIPDEEYDALYRRLLEMEREYPSIVEPYSPTQRVGDRPLVEFKKVIRGEKMLSLDNAFDDGELKEFARRVFQSLGNKRCEFTVEPKIDGLGIELYYRDGVLEKGATRGDGLVGEDVTSNLKTVNSIPLKLKNCTLKELIIRGEVYIEKKDLQRVNVERESKGEPLFKNCRNAAAGSVRLLDPRITAGRPLKAVFYQVVDGVKIASSIERTMEEIKKMGLPVNEPRFVCREVDEIIESLSKIKEQRSGFPHEIDGAVIKVSEYELAQRLGNTSKFPRWAIAYKFSAQRAESRINSITVQVGRTGVLTPVAELKPVFLAGSTVKRATLHNEDEIKKKDIMVGDSVIVIKAGDVIPKVIEVLREKRDGAQRAFKMPSNCPVCGGKVKREEGEAALKCVSGLSCPAQLREHLRYFVSRGSMDIDGMGPSLIEQLVDKNIVRDVADIFSLKKTDLLGLERFADKSAEKIIESIQKSKNEATLEKVLRALGIQFVGESAANAIAPHFKDLNEIMNTLPSVLYEKIESIDGVGPKTAGSFRDFFENKKNRAVILKLLSSGINPHVSKDFAKSGKLKGLSFCITGTLPKPRDEIKKTIAQNGGKFDTSVKKTTRYLIAGEETGEKKIKDAEKKGAKVIGYEEFLKMI